MQGRCRLLTPGAVSFPFYLFFKKKIIGSILSLDPEASGVSLPGGLRAQQLTCSVLIYALQIATSTDTALHTVAMRVVSDLQVGKLAPASCFGCGDSFGTASSSSKASIGCFGRLCS